MTTGRVNTERDASEPAIDPVFYGHMGQLYEIDNTLGEADYEYRESHSVTVRAAQCDAFAQAVYELDGIVAYLQDYLKHMREGVTAIEPGRVIRPRRWGQPRDARGRFVKRTT